MWPNLGNEWGEAARQPSLVADLGGFPVKRSTKKNKTTARNALDDGPYCPSPRQIEWTATFENLMAEAVRTRHLEGYRPGVIELPRGKKIIRRRTGLEVTVSDIVESFKGELLRIVDIDTKQELIRLRVTSSASTSVWVGAQRSQEPNRALDTHSLVLSSASSRSPSRPVPGPSAL
jgi:hypothetical protein